MEVGRRRSATPIGNTRRPELCVPTNGIAHRNRLPRLSARKPTNASCACLAYAKTEEHYSGLPAVRSESSNETAGMLIATEALPHERCNAPRRDPSRHFRWRQQRRERTVRGGGDAVERREASVTKQKSIRLPIFEKRVQSCLAVLRTTIPHAIPPGSIQRILSTSTDALRARRMANRTAWSHAGRRAAR